MRTRGKQKPKDRVRLEALPVYESPNGSHRAYCKYCSVAIDDSVILALPTRMFRHELLECANAKAIREFLHTHSRFIAKELLDYVVAKTGIAFESRNAVLFLLELCRDELLSREDTDGLVFFNVLPEPAP